MYQIQISYRSGRVRQGYIEEQLSYGELVTFIRSQVPSLLDTPAFHLQYENDEGTVVTLSDSKYDIQDFYRCAKEVPNADYLRVKITVVEGFSPAASRNSQPQSPRSTSTPRHIDFGTVLEGNKNKWQEKKESDILQSLEILKDEKIALASQRSELERPVNEPPAVGNNTRNTCTICHRRGHKANNNRNSDGCLVGEPCRGYVFCGRLDKHKHDHLANIKKLKEREAKVNKEIVAKQNELKQLQDFQSRSKSKFTVAATPRLLAAFPEKYNIKTMSGKTELQRDLTMLRIAYENDVNKLPTATDPQSDRIKFTQIFKKQHHEVNLAIDGAKLGNAGGDSSKESCEAIYKYITSSPIAFAQESPFETQKMEKEITTAKKSHRLNRKLKRASRSSSSSDASDVEYEYTGNRKRSHKAKAEFANPYHGYREFQQFPIQHSPMIPFPMFAQSFAPYHPYFETRDMQTTNSEATHVHFPLHGSYPVTKQLMPVLPTFQGNFASPVPVSLQDSNKTPTHESVRQFQTGHTDILSQKIDVPKTVPNHQARLPPLRVPVALAPSASDPQAMPTPTPTAVAPEYTETRNTGDRNILSQEANFNALLEAATIMGRGLDVDSSVE